MKTLKLNKKELFTIYIAIGELENTGMWSDFLSKKETKAVHSGMESLGARFLDELDSEDYLIKKRKEKPAEPTRPHNELYNEVMIKNIIEDVKLRGCKFPYDKVEFIYNENDYVIGVKYADEVCTPALIGDVIDFVVNKCKDV